MTGIVVYGVGSPVVVDVEESLARCGLVVVAAVRNHPADSFFAGDAPLIGPEDLDADMLAHPFVAPLFTPGHRQSAASEAAAKGFRDPMRLVDPTAVLPRRIELGGGCYVNAACSIGACSSLGDFVFVNRGASIGHHARIERFVSLGPGALLAGHVVVEHGAVIGTGATILPEVRIGANAVVAAGSVVTKDVAPQTLVVGNPAVVKRSEIGGYRGITVA